MNQTQDLVKQTFQNDFDRQQFSKFIDRLLKNADFSKRFTQSGINIRQAYLDKVGSFERIAQFTDVDGSKIDVLIVNLKKGSTVERARTALRNFAADYLQKGRGIGKAAALVAYTVKDEDGKYVPNMDWRFSYVTLETSLVKDDTGKFKEAIKHLTPARRFSFLVGKEEKTHTAQKQLLNLLQSQAQPTLKQIEEAFQIEKVTKEFYEEYEKLFRRVEKEIEALRRSDAKLDEHLKENFIESADFAKKLLGQIVFLYFLQKKGWFGVERGAAWGSGNKHFLRYLFEHRAKLGTRQERGGRTEVNFFNDILEHLFYDALARERDEDYYARFDCKIPFLNGGLFEAAYSWSSVDVLLPDALFSNTEATKDGDKGTGILDVFDRYNFTVNEAEPLEKDVAVDPEMLGKVFENLLPENERKGKGSFYTPRPIVNY
ncbi:MAG: class I SAM-dependent DNA methyltransferase, partial [Acidobacteria bacterium]|nr:class I SAM-dependent DNA methyltransferase [Acidobacteriota bacterium]